MEELDRMSCPEDGFHAEKKQEHEDDNPFQEEDNDTQKLVPLKIKFLRNTINHTRHFISMIERPQWQLIALEIVASSMILIQSDR